MKDLKLYPDYRIVHGMQGGLLRMNRSAKCDGRNIQERSEEIALRKRISLILLIAFVPLITALYLVAANLDVNKTYLLALASIYSAYYLAYSIWACSSHCPACGKVMSKKYLFILPSMTCSHCGHELERRNQA